MQEHLSRVHCALYIYVRYILTGPQVSLPPEPNCPIDGHHHEARHIQEGPLMQHRQGHVAISDDAVSDQYFGNIQSHGILPNCDLERRFIMQ
jgi:hypothetical protein